MLCVLILFPLFMCSHSGRRRAGVTEDELSSWRSATAAGSTCDSRIGAWSFQSDQEQKVLNKNRRKFTKNVLMFVPPNNHDSQSCPLFVLAVLPCEFEFCFLTKHPWAGGNDKTVFEFVSHCPCSLPLNLEKSDETTNRDRHLCTWMPFSKAMPNIAINTLRSASGHTCCSRA